MKMFILLLLLCFNPLRLFSYESRPYTLEEGNRLYLLDGPESLTEKYKAMEEATESINLQVLDFFGDFVGKKISELLIKKKQEGLKVQVIVDGLSNTGYGIDAIGASLNRYYDDTMVMFQNMMAAGIPVQGYNDSTIFEFLSEIQVHHPFFFLKRMHEKILTVDHGTPHQRTFIGGINVSAGYYGMGERPQRDHDLLIEGPIEEDIYQGFMINFERWQKRYSYLKKHRYGLNPFQVNSPAYHSFYEQHRTVYKHEDSDEERNEWENFLKKRLRYKRPFPDYGAMQYIQSCPRRNEKLVDKIYIEKIKKAKKAIFIKNSYFLPYGSLRKALKEAVKRGVEVNILTNHSESNQELLLTTISGRLYYKNLIKNGINIYEWKGKRSFDPIPTYYTLHAKVATFDDEDVIIGSANLDGVSKNNNSENMVIVQSPSLNKKLQEIFRQDIIYSDKVTKDQANHYFDVSIIKYYGLKVIAKLLL